MLRELTCEELGFVSGGLGDTKSYKDIPRFINVNGVTRMCPVDEWWNPNFLSDDFGKVRESPAGWGPDYAKYYDIDTRQRCFYDDKGNLTGVFVRDPKGATVLTTSTSDGSASVGGSVAGTGVNGSANDSSSSGSSTTWRQVGR